MNILTEDLPRSVNIDNRDYKINYDFKTAIKFDILMNSSVSDEEKIIKALGYFYRYEIPGDINSAIDEMINFFQGKRDDENNDNSNTSDNKILYSFQYDADYIYSAFMSRYNIDLSKNNIHWWKFKSLFKSLPENTEIVKIIEIRGKKITRDMSKEEKEYYKEMKKVYALPLSEEDQIAKNRLEEALEKGESIEGLL